MTAYSCAAVERLIDFFYDRGSDRVLDSMGVELAKEIVEMADYYQIEPLKYDSDAELVKRVNCDNLCELLAFGDRIKSDANYPIPFRNLADWCRCYARPSTFCAPTPTTCSSRPSGRRSIRPCATRQCRR